ncbi:hypothetical protein ElyMa_005113000 [Elysia marginata]|uniref:Uncharacterized protein n=1 Tax=Elysia marginata TaxID=1093978 RepID=A0AAV4JKI6_9GAST|nr:hypothetical protein ElyMa_005113000 [Elysia marginata]
MGQSYTASSEAFGPYMELEPQCYLPDEFGPSQYKEGTCITRRSSKLYEVAKSIGQPVHVYGADYTHYYSSPEDIVQEFGAYENPRSQAITAKTGPPIQKDNQTETMTKSFSQDSEVYEDCDAVNVYSN